MGARSGVWTAGWGGQPAGGGPGNPLPGVKLRDQTSTGLPAQDARLCHPGTVPIHQTSCMDKNPFFVPSFNSF